MTRVRWATRALATVAVVVGIAGPAAAATPVASVQSAFTDCDSLQQQTDALQARIEALQELLSTATPAQKPGLIKRTGQLGVKSGVLERQLSTCPPSA